MAYYPIRVGWWALPLEGRAGSTGAVWSRGSVEAPTFSLQAWPVKKEKEERGKGREEIVSMSSAQMKITGKSCPLDHYWSLKYKPHLFPKLNGLQEDLKGM